MRRRRVRGAVRHRSGVALTLACVLLPGILTGCSHAAVCDPVAAESGVVFGFARVLAAHPGVQLTVQACVRDDCVRQVLPAEGPPDFVQVADPTLSGAGTVPVSLQLTDRNQVAVFGASGSVTLRRSQPNGPGCPPTVWVARVVASGTDRLDPAPGAGAPG